MDIVTYGNPVLKKPAAPVKEVTPELRKLLDDAGVKAMSTQGGGGALSNGAMVEVGDTTWWEDALGRGYAGGRGSLCHGWSAAIALYTARVILGVEPLEPGFRRYRCEPMALGGMTSASGSVMTPNGPIKVSWHLGPGGIEKVIR